MTLRDKKRNFLSNGTEKKDVHSIRFGVDQSSSPISLPLFSLHIRSMWETICDALASWSGWKFGSKIPVYPILGFGSQNTTTTSPPPPHKNWNLGRSWHLKTSQFWLVENTPSPENWNLGRSWHLKTFQFWLVENTPCWKLKFRQILAFEDFSVLTCGEYPPTPPPSPRKLKFRQILAFEDFSVWTCGEYPPPPHQKLKFRQILAF